jgi:predicted GNAT family acetyltransferase
MGHAGLPELRGVSAALPSPHICFKGVWTMNDNSPTLEVQDNREEHRFEAKLADGMAIAAYSLGNGIITFTHTEVPQAYEGRGIGTALVEAALADVRKRGLKVVPRCAFFATYFERHPEVRDLLAD